MSDFGSRGGGVGATAAKQDVQEVSLDAIQAADEALSKQAPFILADDVFFDNWTRVYISSVIDVSGYRKFLLRNKLIVTGTPGTAEFKVSFTFGGANWEYYSRGPFGSLMYEGSQGNQYDCIDGECLAGKMKLTILTPNTLEFDNFNITSKVILTR